MFLVLSWISHLCDGKLAFLSSLIDLYSFLYTWVYSCLFEVPISCRNNMFHIFNFLLSISDLCFWHSRSIWLDLDFFCILRNLIVGAGTIIIRSQSYKFSFMDLDLGSEMISFESVLTTFEASFYFWRSWGSSKNLLELKIEPPYANLTCLNWWNTL
jgi:hypothetical protein